QPGGVHAVIEWEAQSAEALGEHSQLWLDVTGVVVPRRLAPCSIKFHQDRRPWKAIKVIGEPSRNDRIQPRFEVVEARANGLARRKRHCVSSSSGMSRRGTGAYGASQDTRP